MVLRLSLVIFSPCGGFESRPCLCSDLDSFVVLSLWLVLNFGRCLICWWCSGALWWFWFSGLVYMVVSTLFLWCSSWRCVVCLCGGLETLLWCWILWWFWVLGFVFVVVLSLLSCLCGCFDSLLGHFQSLRQFWVLRFVFVGNLSQSGLCDGFGYPLCSITVLVLYVCGGFDTMFQSQICSDRFPGHIHAGWGFIFSPGLGSEDSNVCSVTESEQRTV